MAYKNPEARRASHAKYRNGNREAVRARQAKWNKDNPEAARDYGVRYRYGNSAPEHFAAQQKEQGGCCAICEKGLSKPQDTHRDHNHETKQLRGVLCAGCNLGLGNFQDDPERLLAAIAYLEKWGGKC